LIITPLDDRNQVERVSVQNLNSVSEKLNVKLPKREIKILDNAHPNGYGPAIVEVIERAVPSFIILLLPNREKAGYDGIKVFLTVQNGLPSQCLRQEMAFHQKSAMIVATNLVILIVSKTGGIPDRVLDEFFQISDLRVIGLARQMARVSAPVVSAVVSKDAHLTQFDCDSSNSRSR
jgi:hypothetical protein